MSGLIIALLCSPLLVYTIYLWKTHTGSFNMISLHWYELAGLIILLLLPLGALKLLKIEWNDRDIPG
jgi:hypothetical protein